MSEAEIKQEILDMLSREIDNRSTVILINSKILDFGMAVYERAFKEASDIVSKTIG